MTEEFALFLDTNVLIELAFEGLAFKAYIEEFKKHLHKHKKDFPIKLVTSDKIIEEYERKISSCSNPVSYTHLTLPTN